MWLLQWSRNCVWFLQSVFNETGSMPGARLTRMREQCTRQVLAETWWWGRASSPDTHTPTNRRGRVFWGTPSQGRRRWGFFLIGRPTQNISSYVQKLVDMLLSIFFFSFLFPFFFVLFFFILICLSCLLSHVKFWCPETSGYAVKYLFSFFFLSFLFSALFRFDLFVLSFVSCLTLTQSFFFYVWPNALWLAVHASSTAGMGIVI